MVLTIHCYIIPGYNGMVDELESRVERLAERLDGHFRMIGEMGDDLVKVSHRLDTLQDRIGALDGRMQHIEDNMAFVMRRLERYEQERKDAE